MINRLLRLGVILTLSKSTLPTSALDSSPSYVGAVVEYHPVTDGDDGQMIAEANANNYRTIIKNASAYKVDIIVFPEFGLTSLPKDGDRERKFNDTEYRAYYRDTASYIPSTNDTVILCDTDAKYAKSLQSISCAAREYKMYVVVNHHEKVDCPQPNCASDNFLLYNTNVVFDRQGRIIARYRKYNLFNEAGTNVTAQPEISTFSTDFGVTFGQLICFDILQETPTTYFVKNPNVTDVVFSTHWFDELPFHSALQEQAAWAYGADVNFLAAGYSDMLTASGGSGIYAGKGGPIRVYHPAETSNALLVAEIPKLPMSRRGRLEEPRAGLSHVHVFKQAEVPTVYLAGGKSSPAAAEQRMWKDDLKPYSTRLLDPSQGSHITTLCDRELCCDFHVETRYDKNLADKPGAKQYRYRLVVFNGVRKFGNMSTAGVEVCALVSCAGDDIDSCGTAYPVGTDVVAPTTFDSLIITRRADLTARAFYEPSTLIAPTGLKLQAFLEPMYSEDFAYLASGQRNSSLLLMYLVRPRNDIITFAIYGRKFDRDGQEPSKPVSAAPTVATTMTMAFVIAAAAVGLASWRCSC